MSECLAGDAGDGGKLAEGVGGRGQEIRPARQVRALWEQRFPELRDRIAQIHNTSRTPKPGRVAVWDNLPQRQRETDAATRLIVSRLSAFSGCGAAAEGLDGVRQASA